MPHIIERYSDSKCKITQSFAFVTAAIIAVLLCTIFLTFFSSQETCSSQIVLKDKINPNYATISSLARLPGIGLGRANAIIDYRRQFRRDNPGVLPFLEPNDLQKVRGIGLKTVESIKPFLRLQIPLS
ncbi:MAG: ComEA family DNA-binding protein [Planctomycetota bacterium]|jgi:competence ComEA-like helix-hairpin-helix protein